MLKIFVLKFSVCFLSLTLIACNSSDTVDAPKTNKSQSSSSPKIDDFPAGLTIPDNTEKMHYQLLFFGNSHVFGLPQKIKMLIEVTQPSKTVEIKTAPNIFYLAERIKDKESVMLLTNNSWTHLILQAQKYSQSGAYDYPTTAAQTFIRMAKSLNITPILFPEHPQAGNTMEGQRVHDIHTKIASIEASCVSPVGLAWDKAITINPALQYHSSDGNHAADIGSLLTSLVLFEVITGFSADLVPYIEAFDIDEDVQLFLGQIASQTIAENKVCAF